MFVRRSVQAGELAPEVDRDELAGLEMLYRDSVELAVGHGVGVHATESPDAPGRGVRIQTEAMPAQEVPRTDAPLPGGLRARRRSGSRSRRRSRRST